MCWAIVGHYFMTIRRFVLSKMSISATEYGFSCRCHEQLASTSRSWWDFVMMASAVSTASVTLKRE